MAIVPKNNKTIDMKISDVIKKLQEIQKEHGDLDVWLGFYGMEEENIYVYEDCVVEIDNI